MIAVISPAKSLDFESNRAIGPDSAPHFLDESFKVNRSLRKYSRKKLMELQGISKELADLNFNRNQIWQPDTNESKQAVHAFQGDVYRGLQAGEWSEANMEWANDHLRILSGLYGILRPSDLIRPYRLEMGTRMKVGRRANLYRFWEEKLLKYFKEEIGPDKILVNLASQEYFKAVETARISNRIIHVEFKDMNKGSYKVISFLAKKARGMMADYIVRNKIEDAEDLKGFDTEGYYFDPVSSNDDNLIFLRDN